MRNQLTILYNTDNQADAQQIVEDLSAYNIDLFLYSEKDFKYNILELCVSTEMPVLVLLSQNWLKCGACLYNSLPGFKELTDKNKIFITTVDGVITENGVEKRIVTEIEKIRDVIPYMKYWQEAFLDVRKERINAPSKENIELEKATKMVSLNLGDLLNFFRSKSRPRISALRRSNYQPVFDQFDFTVEKVEIQDTPIVHAIEVPETVAEITPEETTQSVFKIKPSLPTESNSLLEKLVGKNSTEEYIENTPAATPVEEEIFEEEIVQLEATPLQEEPNPTTQTIVDNSLKTNTLEDDIKVIDLSIDNVLEQAVQFFNDDKDQEGFDLFEMAIQNNYDDNSTLRYYYAYYLAQRKSAFDDAIHQLDTILLYDSKNDNAFFLLAELAEIKENYALAKNYYLQTLQINPDYPHINYRIGVILQEHFEDSKKESAKYLASEMRKDPDNVDAAYRLGIYYSESEDDQLEEAKTAFLTVLDLDRNHAFANYDLALIYHKQGDAQNAAHYYKKGCVNNPELKTEQNDIAFLAPAEKEKKQEQEAPSPMHTFTSNTKVLTKNILITGATSGIGLATAEKFAQEGGCRIILSGRRRNRLVQIKDAIIESFDIEVEILQFDIRDYVAVKEAIGTLSAPFSRIDVLINNAGLALGLSSIASGDLSDWETMIDTNVKGLLYTTKEIAPLMIAQNGGHIINIGSIAGKEAYTNGNVYNATKAAVDILTKSMRLDLHKYNIRVGQVAPGHVETEFALNRFHGDENQSKIYEDFKPLAAKDIANIIYFMVNQPEHVNIQDVLVFPTQQASATVINRSGRK